MGIEIATGGHARSSAVPATAAAKPAKAGQPGGPKTAETGDQVTLSPEARALATLQAMTGNGSDGKVKTVTRTAADEKAIAAFKDKLTDYFAKTLGIDRGKIAAMELNDDAMRYLMRNTVMGALAPPALRRELGMDLANRGPKTGALAEVSLLGKDEKPLARFAFDGDALEEMARQPLRKKDKDRDGMFSILDLMPKTKELGSKQLSGERFPEADRRFAASMDGGPRVALFDDERKPVLLAHFRNGVDKPRIATAQLAFGLLQFAGGAPR